MQRHVSVNITLDLKIKIRNRIGRRVRRNRTRIDVIDNDIFTRVCGQFQVLNTSEGADADFRYRQCRILPTQFDVIVTLRGTSTQKRMRSIKNTLISLIHTRRSLASSCRVAPQSNREMTASFSVPWLPVLGR